MIFTSYFNTLIDPQRQKFWEGNDFETIQVLYDSVEMLELDMIVFHDHLTDKFIKDHTTKNIEVVYYKPSGDVLNARWVCYRENIKAEYDKVLCLDAFDTRLNKDPFVLFEPGKLLVGSENMKIKDCGYIVQFSERAYDKVIYPEKQLLNCGILGGFVPLMKSFLDDYHDELGTAKIKRCIDMALVNTIIYRNYQFITGDPIHTRLGKNDNGCYIKHK